MDFTLNKHLNGSLLTRAIRRSYIATKQQVAGGSLLSTESLMRLQCNLLIGVKAPLNLNTSHRD